MCAPATCYNGLGVGCYGVGAASSIGPTVDNGRSKPDLTAPSTYTSFSTPYVSGAGAVLLQAAANGAGGTNLAAAGDLRTRFRGFGSAACVTETACARGLTPRMAVRNADASSDAVEPATGCVGRCLTM